MAKRSVAEIWRAIEKRFESESPGVVASFAPGANSEALARLERALGSELPSELAESLRIHDGQRPNGEGLYPNAITPWLSAAEIAAKHELLVSRSAIPAGWIPLAFDREDGFELLDMEPGPTRGRVIELTPQGVREIASTFVGWLERLAGAAGIDVRPPATDEEREAKRLLERARERKSRGEFDAALADLDRALGLVPDLRDAHAQTALILKLLGRPGAVEAYERALAARRSWSGRAAHEEDELRSSLASAREAAGDLEGALSDLGQIVERTGSGYAGRARIHEKLGKIDDAIVDLERASAAHPDAFDSIWHWGELLLARGRKAEALAAWDRCPMDTRERRGQRSVLRAELGDPGAREDLEEFLKLSVKFLPGGVSVPLEEPLVDRARAALESLPPPKKRRKR